MSDDDASSICPQNKRPDDLETYYPVSYRRTQQLLSLVQRLQNKDSLFLHEQLPYSTYGKAQE